MKHNDRITEAEPERLALEEIKQVGNPQEEEFLSEGDMTIGVVEKTIP